MMDILDKLLRANRVDATIGKRKFNLRSNCRMFLGCSMHAYHVCDGHWILRIWKLPRLARMLVDDAEHGLPVLRTVRGGVVQDVGEGGEKGI